VLPSIHHLLFVLLPLALAARLAIRPRPATLDVAQGVMRFCLGFGKWVLLFDPLWHLSGLVLRGGADSLSGSVAWMGFLALMLALRFLLTAVGDLTAGLCGMFGIKPAEKMEAMFMLQGITQGKLMRHLLLLVMLAVIGTLAHGAWLPLKALFAPAPRSIATVFQESRVITDFHVITMIAALACLISLPWSRDFLRTPQPWKAVICLLTFLLAAMMLWTRVSPIS
jgi:hypothetical protein